MYVRISATSSDIYLGLTLEGGCSVVVVHEIFHPLVRVALLPAKGEWQLICHGHSGILPLSRLALVVHKIHPTVGKHPLLCVITQKEVTASDQ